MAVEQSAFIVRNTFLEVFDEVSAESEAAVRRWHSAPPTVGARHTFDDEYIDPFEQPRMASSSALYDSPTSKRERAWEPSMSKILSQRDAEAAAAAAEEPVRTSRRNSRTFTGEGLQQLEEEGLEGRDINTMTTVILRNVPHSYTRDDLIGLLNMQGFYQRYDFLYLPVKFGSSSAFGYAFINLVEHEDAKRFQAHFQNFNNWNVPSDNIASVSWSKAHQGLAEHIERYRNSPMMHPEMPDDCKPIILRNGQRVPFPAPTKKAQPQRRADRAGRHSRKSHGSKGTPGSVSSLASESSDHWKAASVSSTSTPAGGHVPSPTRVAEPMSSPLFGGLTWLGGTEERAEPARSDVGLYQLTTQMICGSDCSSELASERSLRSSAPSMMTSVSGEPSTCSSKGRRSYGTTLLAAGLEAVPDVGEPLSQGSQLDEPRRRQKDRKWWNGFGASNGNTLSVPSSGPTDPRRAPRPESSRGLNSTPGPLLSGSIVELMGGAGPPGQQGRILVVDHAREQYKVQLSDGNIRMVKARQVRFIR